MQLSGRNIVIVSNEPWNALWFSKHHYANQLSKNNKVWFIDPPLSWNLFSTVSRGITELRVQPGLTVLQYRNAFPFNGAEAFFASENSKVIYKLLNRYFKKNNIEDIFFLSFDPFRLLDPRQLQGVSFSVYFRVDYFTNKGEAQLCRNVDLILVITNEMIPDLEHFGKPIYFIPHGISDDIADLGVPAGKQNQILMMGTISPRVDYALLEKVAKAHPGITLKLVGPLHLLDLISAADKKILKRLERAENVVFSGAMTFPEVCRQIRESRVCLVAYRHEQKNYLSNSLKILQYLAFGKPVVSGLFYEMSKAGAEGLLRMSADHDQYLKNLEEALAENEDQKLINRRMDYAFNFRYSNLIRDIERIAGVVKKNQTLK